MALATLSIDLDARLAKMEQGFDKATRLSERFAAEQERRFQAVKSAATGIGVAIAGAFSVTQIVQMTRATINGLDALNDLKDATGASIENISALEDVAARTGTSFDSVASTLVKFNKVLGDSKPGSEAANTLKALGLSADELRKLDPAEALRQTAVALAQFADDGNKARVIQELFGKSVQEAAPFLKDLAEQGQLNATVTTAQAQAAEDFNKQLFALQKNLQDSGRAMVSDLLPALNTFFERLKGIKAAGGIGAFFGSVGNEMKANLTSEEIADTVREIEILQKRLDFGNRDERPGLERRLGALRQRFLDLQSQAAATNAELLGFANTVAPLAADYSNEGRTRPRPTVGDLPSADRKGPKVKKEKDPLVGPLAPSDVMEERNALEREYQSLLKRTPTGILEHQRALMQQIAEAYEDGRLGIVGSTEAQARFNELVNTALPKAVETALPEIERLADESSEFFREAARNIQDAMGDTLVDVLEGDFDDIGKMWQRLLVRMAAQAAAAQLNKQLFGSEYGNTGQLGGLLGSIFNPGASSYPSIAGGAGDSSLYNVPSSSVSSLGAGPMSAGSGAGRLSAGRSMVFDFSGQTIQVGQGVSRAEVQAAVRQANAETEARIRGAARQGALQ